MANKATRYLDKRKNGKGETQGIKVTDLITEGIVNKGTLVQA